MALPSNIAKMGLPHRMMIAVVFEAFSWLETAENFGGDKMLSAKLRLLSLSAS